MVMARKGVVHGRGGVEVGKPDRGGKKRESGGGGGQ